jgi:hypothetical protein
MCCFTGVVVSVAATKIFARAGEKGRQYLVYSMRYEAKDELAMVLPLPTPRKSAEDAVKFISLEKYDNFFADMEKGFPAPKPRGLPNLAAGGLGGHKPDLAVVEVGSYEASFVPSVADFARLDKRFRLPDGVWEKLPGYKEYGFAVFKLKADKTTVHPMAFDFPRARPKQMFFPTVHIHDGEVHDTADFDHVLYVQMSQGSRPPRGWRESTVPAGMHMDLKRSQGLLDGESHAYRQELRGKLKNADTLVGAA